MIAFKGRYFKFNAVYFYFILFFTVLNVNYYNKILSIHYQEQLQANIAAVIRESTTGSTESIDRKLNELQKELLKKANNKEAYDKIAEQIFALREQKKLTTDTNP